MSIIKSIEKKLHEAFNPDKLEVINESHLHAGHQPGFDGTGESHIRIRIISNQFDDITLIDRHRKINALLDDEIRAGLHAVAIEAHSPAEKSV
ncbi:MAG: BolA family transcriptional regulator [Hyphomicrobiales bacterium]|nr:BolA family transcriptional regulator [Hyphomicrobiales bacterium]